MSDGDEPVETGLSGLRVEPAEQPSLPVIVTGTVTAPITLDNFDLSRLAREIAMDIRELPAILATFKISVEQYAAIREHPYFKRILDAAIIDWNSALSTHGRIKIEAAAALEDALPVVAARMTNKEESLAMVTEAGKLMAKLAGIGENAREQQSSEKFNITINLGADTVRYEKNVAPSGGAGAVPTVLEGEVNAAAVQAIRKGD